MNAITHTLPLREDTRLNQFFYYDGTISWAGFSFNIQRLRTKSCIIIDINPGQ